MSRTITIKGIGTAKAKVDYIVISMTLESLHKNYDKAMDLASDKIRELNESLMSIGYLKQNLKTINFNIDAEYGQIKDYYGSYKNIFSGYKIVHNLKLEFDFDTDKLSKTLSVIARCLSHPELNITFTIKDTSKINEELLKSATINAKRKAEILCEASNVILGDLISIDYNWGELDIYSNTHFTCKENIMTMMESRSIDFMPDDIKLEDTATFIWEIK